MPPTTDRELLQTLDLRESFVASLIGKTRQAVSGGLVDTARYFRDGDMSTLVNYCRVNKPTALPELTAYINTSRGEKSARDILSGHGMFLSHEAIQAAQEIWVVLPDFRFFKASHLSQALSLQERAHKNVSNFLMVTGDQRDADQFWSEIADTSGIDPMDRTLVEETVDAMPYTLLLEPNSDKLQGWALVTGGFQRIDPIRTEGMRSFLSKKVRANLPSAVPAARVSQG